MRKIRYDYHVHSSISPDGRASMEEMCESAIEKGMEEVVFTDHYEFYAHGVTRQWFHEEYLKRYFETVGRCREQFAGRLTVKSGMEYGQLHLYPERTADFVKSHPYDFVLGAVHKIENVDLAQITVTKENAEWIGDAYYYHLLELSEVGEFDCIAHLDYFKKHCAKQGLPDLYEKYQPFIKKVLENVIKRGKGIELNTACMGGVLEETMPGPPTLALYKELGGTIVTVGSDSHRPERIGYGFDAVYQELKKAGFRAVATYQNRICTLKAF
ncbi:MAG: histidinol-phosphatase HisJ family protein [Eubacteriales bacterium]|nr:histidinol-phosphatase HisJ family protein [Eubacteriales bacterium]